MEWKGILIGILSIIMIFLIFIYWFLPFEEVRFGVDKNPEFSIGNISEEMQFYKNMRFQTTEISYKISSGCSLEKKSEMTEAFNYIEDLTLLDFYPVNSGEQIEVTCENKPRTSEDGLFVAGEGGPTKIISGENFHIILEGQILLLRESKCERPNVPIHELLHVLGFNHSENKNNIMYPVTSCSQTIGTEIPDKINKLYSYPSLPDLKLSNVSASTEGRYLDLNLSVRNIGIADAGKGTLYIYADDEVIKKMELSEIKAGNGLNIGLRSIWVTKRNVNKIKIKVELKENELSLENNEIILEKLPG